MRLASQAGVTTVGPTLNKQTSVVEAGPGNVVSWSCKVGSLVFPHNFPNDAFKASNVPCMLTIGWGVSDASRFSGHYFYTDGP